MLAEKFFQLDTVRKRRVHMLLCQSALEQWELYAQAHAPIEYIDSVVGMHHRVDIQLPRDAFTCAQRGEPDQSIWDSYTEPIVSLQDDDLSFPSHIEFAYYAIYNLFRKYCLEATIDDWVIVNQALAAQDPSLQRQLLQEAIDNSAEC